jgi:hypothetical protein
MPIPTQSPHKPNPEQGRPRNPDPQAPGGREYDPNKKPADRERPQRNEDDND